MLTVLLIILCGLILAILVIISIGYLLSVPPYKGPVTGHFDGQKFHNPSGVPAKGFREVFKFMREERGTWHLRKDAEARRDTLEKKVNGEVRVTFVNHSSFLIQKEGMNILTDPVWSERCSPVQWAGPKRLRPPGVRFEDLPPIDLVLLTHNHYDHFDVPTVKRLRKEHDPQFIVPLGLSRFVRRLGITKVAELDWWGHMDVNNLRITATPANHFSSRGMFDRDRTLWCGYLVESGDFTLYFVGDTGYSDIFREIGRRAGQIDLALIPIGAYEPRWFMSPIHVNPPEAVQIHRDVHARMSMAMHFGTFPLANEGSGAAERDLREALADQDIPEAEFLIPEEGRTYTLRT